jgi:hypothetical protein
LCVDPVFAPFTIKKPRDWCSREAFLWMGC